jgi:addiction module HigA family antidote
MSKSSTTTRSKRKPNLIPNPHPGEILLEDLLKPMGMSQNALARALKVSPRRINELVLGKRAVSADTDLRLARYFNLHEGFFLGLQADYDLMEEKRRLGKRLLEITPLPRNQAA